VKSRDVILTFVTAVVIVGMNVFVSCSSQQPKQTSEEEDLMALSVAEVSDLNTDGTHKDPLLGDPNAMTAPADAPVTSSSGGETLGSLEGVPDENSGASAESSLPPISESNDLPPIANTPERTTAAPRQSAPTYSGGTYVAAVPLIPAKAVVRGGVSLNRFYFVRAGDTRASVAELLYGDKKRAAEMARWNTGFRPGKPIYYQSASNATDDQMRSFYQERNVPGEEYAVRSGDWLSKIAQSRFRSPWSWTEIAVTNGIDRPERIARGTKIALYPKDLSSFRVDGAPQAIANHVDAPARKDRRQPMPEPKDERNAGFPTEPPQVAAIEPPAGLPPSNPGNDAPTTAVAPNGDTVAIPDPGSVESFTKGTGGKAAGSLNLMQLLEKNLFMLGLVALAVMLLLVLVAVSKRRKQMEAIEDEPLPVGARGKR